MIPIHNTWFNKICIYHWNIILPQHTTILNISFKYNLIYLLIYNKVFPLKVAINQSFIKK